MAIKRNKKQSYATITALRNETIIPTDGDSIYLKELLKTFNWVNGNTSTDDSKYIINQTSESANGRWVADEVLKEDLDLKVNASDLPSNLFFYPTTTASDIPAYFKLVNDLNAPDYDNPAVDVSTGAITTTNQLISSLASSSGILTGNPGVVNLTVVGNIKKISGSGTADFYFEAYHRDNLGVETLVGTSNNTSVVTNSTYEQFSATLLWNDGNFDATDRVVLKFYGNRIAGGSNPVYDFQFGGATPVRAIFPVSFYLLAGDYELKANKQDSLLVDGTGTKYPTVDAITTALTTKADLVAGKVPASQLPSYVDDVLEFANFSALPVTGETGKIYVTLDNNKIYRWSGSVYVNMTESTIPNLQEVTDVGSTTTNKLAIFTSGDPAIEAFSNTHNAINAISTNNSGLYAASTTGTGALISSVSGTGALISTDSGTGLNVNSTSGIGQIIDTSQFNINDSLQVNKQNVGTVFKVSHDGNVTANSFIKSGGLSTEFLKADGSVDTASYLTGLSGWGTQGNAGTNPATDFIGTTDAQPLVFKTNGVERARFTGGTSTNLGLGTTTPTYGIDNQVDWLGAQYGQMALGKTGQAGGITFRRGSDGSPQATIGYSSQTESSNLRISSSGGGSFLTFWCTSSERVRIDANGNFGINTTAPTKRLDINGETRIRTIPAGLSTEEIIVANANGDLRKIASSTFYLATNPNGYTNNLGTVTSVALANGTTGTDVNISGSPITTNGTITLNIPTASATNRGALSAANWTTFNNKINLDVNGGIGLPIIPISTPIANSIRNDGTNIIYTDLSGTEFRLGNGQFVDKEIPTGLINGTNTTFTLANTPIVGSEHVYRNGLLQESGAGNDYTISGATITYLTAPLTGDKLRVTYRR